MDFVEMIHALFLLWVGKKEEKKARLKHLFRFKAYWLADKLKQRGPHRVREREQMQEIEEALSDKKDT